MTKATIRIPKDAKHRIVIPNELWEAQELEEGNLIEVDIVKINLMGSRGREVPFREVGDESYPLQ